MRASNTVANLQGIDRDAFLQAVKNAQANLPSAEDLDRFVEDNHAIDNNIHDGHLLCVNNTL